jgi:hypothetical protein
MKAAPTSSANLPIHAFQKESTSMQTSASAISPSIDLKKLFLFEKEKGGTGSTGSLSTAAHVSARRGKPIAFIECSIMQMDVANAYGEHHPVEVVDLTSPDAADRIIDAVVRAPQGAYIFANIPGGRIEQLDAAHQVFAYALSEGLLSAKLEIVWTMGLDAASRSTLDVLLECALPGPIHLNLPAWHAKKPEEFANVDDGLRARIATLGGQTFQTPEMPEHLYNLFRTREVAFDRIASLDGVSIGNKAAFGLWEQHIATALREVF